jgi:hypothetical protein
MKSALALLLLSAAAAFGQITNLTFTWNPAANAEVYRFYDGNKLTLLGSTTTNFFTVTNWNVTQSRTVSVTSSNEIGESEADVKTVKPASGKPNGTRTVPLSIVSPVPGVVEISQDLVDWTQRIRLAPGTSPTNVSLTWVQYPTEPMMFLRSRLSLNLTAPPQP